VAGGEEEERGVRSAMRRAMMQWLVEDGGGGEEVGGGGGGGVKFACRREGGEVVSGRLSLCFAQPARETSTQRGTGLV
jgi:hypothetical protein